MKNKIHENKNRVKGKIHDNEIIFRAIENALMFKGFSDEYELAEMFKLSRSSFSNKKGRGTILYDILDWAIYEKVNLDELFRGKIIKEENGWGLSIKEIAKMISWIREKMEKEK